MLLVVTFSILKGQHRLRLLLCHSLRLVIFTKTSIAELQEWWGGGVGLHRFRNFMQRILNNNYKNAVLRRGRSCDHISTIASKCRVSTGGKTYQSSDSILLKQLLFSQHLAEKRGWRCHSFLVESDTAVPCCSYRRYISKYALPYLERPSLKGAIAILKSQAASMKGKGVDLPTTLQITHTDTVDQRVGGKEDHA